MAYFANSTEGAVLDNQCIECIHADPEAHCPIAFIQMEFNYDQLNDGNEDLKKAMGYLINDKGECNMKYLIDTMKDVVNKNRKCFKRPLKFGDEEQIAALS